VEAYLTLKIGKSNHKSSVLSLTDLPSDAFKERAKTSLSSCLTTTRTWNKM